MLMTEENEFRQGVVDVRTLRVKERNLCVNSKSM